MEVRRKMNPLISVIIPVYNVESYLARCLDSIVGNTYRELEIICINDGSTDSSLRILNEYARKDGRIHVYSQNNKGVTAARNKGLEKACGEWISFVDADDWIHPQYFELLIEAWRLKGSSADIVCCQCVMPDKYCMDSQHYSVSDDIVSELSWDGINRYLFLCSTLWMRIYKRSLIGDFRLPENLISAEDTAANMIIMGRSASLNALHVSLHLYYYYQRQSSAVHTSNVAIRFPALNFIFYELDGFPSTVAKHRISELLLCYLSNFMLYRDTYDKTIYRDARALYRRVLAKWKTTRMHAFSQLSTYAKYLIWYYFPGLSHWYCLLRNPQLRESLRTEASKPV